MRAIFLAFILISGPLSICGQVIPDLTIGDHFRPNLSEKEKQEQIRESKNGYPKTSEELYPHLYKYTKEDYLGPIKGTTSDPSNAFKNYAQIGFTNKPANSNYHLPQSVYDPGRSIQQRNQAIIDADMATYSASKEKSAQLINDAFKELEEPSINYNLGIHTGPSVDPYLRAYTELEGMLTGKQKIDFLKATWLVESSVDASLSWEEFNRMFTDDLQIIKGLMAQDKLSPRDNLGKLMSVYKFMADTTTVYLASKEKKVTSKPMLYDFEDYEAKKDITKVFVSKLLRTGTGQCMSLPMLYYLYANALGAEAHLAFAPEHSYITFKDNLGNSQNIELTGRMFTTSDFYWQTGFIKAEQVKSGIYLTPISEKETIAYLLTTLTLSYVRTFGTDDRVLEMALTAREHFPNSLTANMILAGYSQDLWRNVLRQYEVYAQSENKLQQDERAQAIKKQKEESLKYLYRDLGWSKMPDWAYQKWLEGVNELAVRKQHLVRRRQLEHQLNK